MINKITTLLFVISVITSCSKDAESDFPPVLSSENKITSFQLEIKDEIINGNIDQAEKTISFNVVGADISSLIPTVVYSEKAKISPLETVSQNFNSEVAYTVYAENGESKIYRVIINNRPLSKENKILSFLVNVNDETISADINQETHLITFNIGQFDKTQLKPNIKVSEFAAISPQNNSVNNFENITIYTVIAENGDETNYKVVVNAPKVSDISTLGGSFSFNPILVYSRADLIISGAFIDPDRPDAELYLTDGTTRYSLPFIKSSLYHTTDYITEYSIYTKIPENIPTYSKYKLVYRIDDFITESEGFIDVISENVPKPLELNQDLYESNDVLIISGENLTDMIAIPSNGSVYLIKKSNSYDLMVNSERTEIRLTLDYYRLFPSYFGNYEKQQKVITLLGPNRRAGETIIAVFK